MKMIALPSMVGLLLCLHAAPAEALSQTYVSRFGNDLNNCGISTPCRTFQVAHTNTDPGGVIDCLDSGDFGVLNISKSITINCTGHNAQIAGGLTVTTPNVRVIIRGLAIENVGAAGVGIEFQNGSTLHIENCKISNYNAGVGAGIYFRPSDASELFITDSEISQNGNGASGGGIVVHPMGSGSALVALNRVTLNRNSNGIFAQGLSTTGAIVVEVRDSSVARSTSHGILVVTDASPAGIVIERSSAVLNAGNGIKADGSGALVHLSNSTVRGNSVGLSVSGGGQILSFQNNQIAGNGTDGAPTGVLTAK